MGSIFSFVWPVFILLQRKEFDLDCLEATSFFPHSVFFMLSRKAATQILT